jgi:hypothetical protein
MLPPEFGKSEGRPADPYATVEMTIHVETILSVPKQNCHPDRSVAERRDLRCALRASPKFWS